MARTIAFALIAVILGAWLAFVVFGSDDDDHGATYAIGETHATTDASHTHEGDSAMPIAAMMAADPAGVGFCVGATLEPYDGAMDQLRDTGPTEAAERMRSCVFDTIVGHGDDTTMADLESHREHFNTCFGELKASEQIDKPRAVEQTAACILAGLATP